MSPSTDRPSHADLSKPRPKKKGRVAAVVGLSLLEVIRARDLPSEILASEDPTQTMPRRLGLSEVVDLQIRRFREQVKRKEHLTEDEARDLFQLVMRRPDSEEVFFQAGELLGEDTKPLRGLKRVFPHKFRNSMARRLVRKRIRSLFGRPMGGFAQGLFTLEATGHFFLDMDPGGEACALVTGLSRTVLTLYLRSPMEVKHTTCEGRKDDLCRWVASPKGP